MNRSLPIVMVRAPAMGWVGLNQLFDASPVRPGAVLNPPVTAAPLGEPGDALRLTHPAPSPAAHRARYQLVVPVPRQTAAYRRTFRILLSKPEFTDRYDEIILKYAREFGLDARLIKAVIAAESEFNPKARSPKGALGLMQVMPATAEQMGVSRARLADPEQNVLAGALYLRRLFEAAWPRFKLVGVSFKDAPLWVVQRVIAAYNAGPRFLFRGTWYRQTRSYVRKVLLFYQTQVTDIRRPHTTPQALPDIPMSGFQGLLF